MYVTSVCDGFMIEIYGFMRTFLARATHGAIAMEDLEDRRWTWDRRKHIAPHHTA